MSEFTDLTHLPITDDVPDSVGMNDPTTDNDASSDEGDTVGGDESDADQSEMGDEDDIGGEDIEGDDVGGDVGGDDEDGADGAYDEEAGEPGTMEDDDASVSSADSDGSDDSDCAGYFQKFDSQIRQDIIGQHHAESTQVNYEEVNTLCEVVRNAAGKIIDPFHKTVPILSKFEKTRVLGLRAKQINEGAKPFVEMNQTNYDGYVVASQELIEKKIPFIIRRPLPSGASEYWRIHDLEILC
jgi:DNA-directed RNA polymerase I, II, and III subunit RPABC2